MNKKAIALFTMLVGAISLITPTNVKALAMETGYLVTYNNDGSANVTYNIGYENQTNRDAVIRVNIKHYVLNGTDKKITVRDVTFVSGDTRCSTVQDIEVVKFVCDGDTVRVKPNERVRLQYKGRVSADYVASGKNILMIVKFKDAVPGNTDPEAYVKMNFRTNMFGNRENVIQPRENIIQPSTSKSNNEVSTSNKAVSVEVVDQKKVAVNNVKNAINATLAFIQ